RVESEKLDSQERHGPPLQNLLNRAVSLEHRGIGVRTGSGIRVPDRNQSKRLTPGHGCSARTSRSSWPADSRGRFDAVLFVVCPATTFARLADRSSRELASVSEGW